MIYSVPLLMRLEMVVPVVVGLESGLQYDVVVLAATRTGFPSVREEDWLWVSHLVTGSETLACNLAVIFTT